jgi:hypothetical protein
MATTNDAMFEALSVGVASVCWSARWRTCFSRSPRLGSFEYYKVWSLRAQLGLMRLSCIGLTLIWWFRNLELEDGNALAPRE